MVPTNQFGGLPGKSSEDMTVVAIYDVKVGFNHKCGTLVVMFNIQGFFDNISHSILLNTMRNLHFLVSIVKWVKSFCENRKSAICLDRRHNILLLMNTGIPQGLYTSPTLAMLYTIGLVKTISEAMRYKNLPTEAEVDLLTLNQQSNTLSQEDYILYRFRLATFIIYVNDRQIAVVSTNLNMNIQLLSLGVKVVNQWLKDHNMTID